MIQFLQSPLLSAIDSIGHAFLEKEGGVSEGPFASLNGSFWVEDDPRHVQENLARIQRHFDLQHLHIAHQSHSTRILCADGASATLCGEGDALWTREPGRGVMVLHADCQPILLADTRGHAVAAIHAGWRGLMKGILPCAIRELQRIGCPPNHLAMAIGPSLGPSSAEFRHYQHEFPHWAWRYRDEHDRFNLWEIATDQAIETGIPRAQIDILSIDTRQDRRFFSYRFLPRTGRNGSLIWLREGGARDHP